MGGERGPAHGPGAMQHSPGCKVWYLWSLLFISVITFYGPGFEPRPKPLIVGGAQAPPPPAPTQQDASASHEGSGRPGFVVSSLTLQHDPNYVRLLSGPQDS